jgi:hypothetical protein
MGNVMLLNCSLYQVCLTLARLETVCRCGTGARDTEWEVIAMVSVK